jgi:hypothetical protein
MSWAWVLELLATEGLLRGKTLGAGGDGELKHGTLGYRCCTRLMLSAKWARPPRRSGRPRSATASAVWTRRRTNEYWSWDHEVTPWAAENGRRAAVEIFRNSPCMGSEPISSCHRRISPFSKTFTWRDSG